jgi:hypothetical protein
MEHCHYHRQNSLCIVRETLMIERDEGTASAHSLRAGVLPHRGHPFERERLFMAGWCGRPPSVVDLRVSKPQGS